MIVHNSIINGLSELSDLERQKRVWLGIGQDTRAGAKYKISSLEDAVSQVFLYSGLYHLLGLSEVVFSIKIDEKFRELHRLVSPLYGTIVEESDLQSDDMRRIRALSMKLLDGVKTVD